MLAGLEFPAAFAVIIQQFILDMAAFADGSAVVFNTCDTSGAEPFDVADIGHSNSGLDTMFNDLESDRPG